MRKEICSIYKSQVILDSYYAQTRQFTHIGEIPVTITHVTPSLTHDIRYTDPVYQFIVPLGTDLDIGDKIVDKSGYEYKITAIMGYGSRYESYHGDRD